jgi:hypothetical protein
VPFVTQPPIKPGVGTRLRVRIPDVKQ